MAYTGDQYLVKAIMSAQSGLTEDQIVNDWAFTWTGAGDPFEADFVSLMAAVDQFYNGDPGSGDMPGKYISAWVNRSATHSMAIYQLTAPPIGSPVFEDDWLGPTSPYASSALPLEVAGVVSFHADLTGVPEESGATRPKARRRGRVFVGPLIDDAITGDTPPYMLSAAFTLALRANINFMADTALADDWTFGVWSRADQTVRPAVGGWTDNAPDTQRRRGKSPTTRVTYSIV